MPDERKSGAELPGKDSITFFKTFCKVTDILKAAGFGYGGKRFIAGHQKIGGHGQAILNEIFDGTLIDNGAKAAETFPFADMAGVGNLFNGHGLAVIFMNEIKHFMHAGHVRDIFEGGISKQIARFKFMEKALPDAADHFHGMQFIILFFGTKRLKFAKKAQHERVFLLIRHEKKAVLFGVHHRKNDFLI